MLFERSLRLKPPRRLPVLQLALAIVLAGSACNMKRESKSDPYTSWLILQGTQALDQRNFRLAMAFVDSAVKQAPTDSDMADVYYLRGQIYSSVGRIDNGDADYRRVLSLEPNYREVWNKLGDNAYQRQLYQQALDCYLKESAINLTPISMRGVGRSYLKLGLIDSARHAFDRALALDSLYLPAYLDLVLLFEEEGLWEVALQNAQTALRHDPENLDFHYLAGSNLFRMGQGEAAASHLKIVVEAWPWHELATYNLGRTFMLLGNESEAQKYLDQAEVARSQNVQITLLEETVKVLPDDPMSHAKLGYALSQLGRYNYAMYAYQAALELDPENLEVLVNTANLCLNLKDTTSAIYYYYEALQIQPSLVVALVNLGSIYAMLNDLEAAQKVWQTALIYDPENSVVKGHLAKISGDSQ